MTNRDPDARYEKRLSQAINFFFEQKRKELHTSLPGLVQEYDPLTKRAKVQPALRLALQDGSELDKPPILDVPVRQPATGGHLVHHEIRIGDVVLLTFSERGLEQFKLAWGELATPGTGMLDERDAMAIPWGVETIMPVETTGWIVQSESGEVYVTVQGEEGAERIRAEVEPETHIELEGPTQTITFHAGDNTITITPDKVTVQVSSGERVHIGGESGQALATAMFISGQYNQHFHSTGVGPSGPPMVPAPMVPGGDITDKQRSE